MGAQSTPRTPHKVSPRGGFWSDFGESCGVFWIDLGRIFSTFFNAREIISQEVYHEIAIQFWLGHGGGKAEGKRIMLFKIRIPHMFENPGLGGCRNPQCHKPVAKHMLSKGPV